MQTPTEVDELIIKYSRGKPTLNDSAESLPVTSSVNTSRRKRNTNPYSIYLCWQRIDENAHEPTRGTPQSAGWDLYASADTVIPKNNRTLINTSICIQLPAGCYGRIAPRSSLAVRGIDVGAGVIDADYQGEIKVLLINATNADFMVRRHDKIAQLILEQYVSTSLKEIPDLKKTFGNTQRGDGGFGSTGK